MNASGAASSDHRHKVLVVDDHPVVREGVTQCLNHENDFVVCETATNASEALRAVHRCRPDAAVIDLTLPDRHGLDLIKDIHAQHKRVAILVFTMLDESVFALRALRAGAKGYVMKHEPAGRLTQSLRSILRGEGPVVSPQISARVLQELVASPNSDSSPKELTLSDTDLMIFEYVGRGLGTREIAERLARSIKTVESHYMRIKKTLCLQHHTDMICRAVRWVDTEH